MQYRRLGRTDIQVSALCLGTMTFGEQNNEAECHAQLDYALEHGINFIDTAEMYAVPVREETYGRSEAIIGVWLARRRNRDKVILATKVIGPDTRFAYIRDGKPRLNRRHIEAAVDASLRRLQTDYIDLYQLHWPDRTTNTFGKLDYKHVADEDPVALEETLTVMAELLQAGKIRAIGISNETPWGMMRYLQLGEQLNLPRIASIQNPYNLLNRIFEIGLSEIAIREDCGLLAYGVLASGMLTGKYLGGAKPRSARLTRWPDYFQRYLSKGSLEATGKYVRLARTHNLDPAAMAIAYAAGRPFMTSAIVGVTSLDQLKIACEAAALRLSDEVLDGLDAIHAQQPNAYLVS